MIETHNEVVRRIRALGYAAQSLLMDDGYKTVMNALSDFHLTAMVETKPEDTAARNQHHTMLHALREIHSEIESYVQALHEIEAAEDEDQTQEPT